MQFPMGTLTITGDADTASKGQLGSHEQVEIAFAPKPFPASPVTNKINFTQIARSPEAALGRRPSTRTMRSRIVRGRSPVRPRISRLRATPRSLCPSRISAMPHSNTVLQANTGRLTWWMAQSQPGSDNTTRPLPVGVTLSVPNAVAGGYVQDIDPVADYSPKKLVQPRTAPTDPAIPGAYPHMKKAMILPGGYMGPVYGYNRGDGSSLAATMVDTPGGGPFSGTFAFETYAHSEDLGITYGGVRWGFQYRIQRHHWRIRRTAGRGFGHCKGGTGRLQPNLPQRPRCPGRRHAEQPGTESDRGDASHAGMIYQMNRTVLSTADPSAPIPPGTLVKVGTGPTIWDRAGTVH